MFDMHMISPSSPPLTSKFSKIQMPTEDYSPDLSIERLCRTHVPPFLYESFPRRRTVSDGSLAASRPFRVRTISLPPAEYQQWHPQRAMTGPFDASPMLMAGLYYDLTQPPDVALRTELLSNTLGLYIPATVRSMPSFFSSTAINPPTPNILVTIPPFGVIPIMASDGVAVRCSDILVQIHDFLWSPLLDDLVQVNGHVYNAYERRTRLTKNNDHLLRNIDALLNGTVFLGLEHDQCDRTGMKWIVRLGGLSAVQV